MKCSLFIYFLPWDLLLRIHEAVRVVCLQKTEFCLSLQAKMRVVFFSLR
ncbi:hypothetical protein NC653_001954 [Populus alba x Populus x berolinensis]|uniref:Uncharacterized protein n=1 Tax=Populus alba x Populus x berolinensis TaxID=444605 RepID=A0AAD6RME9_9ROSI|nr:hypothetical protein NC653_001954 [Populus alba x Populus x berolinensis]